MRIDVHLQHSRTYCTRANRVNHCREEESPAANGKWKYEWRDDVQRYVKPQYADAVLATLAKNGDNVKQPPQMSDEVSFAKSLSIMLLQGDPGDEPLMTSNYACMYHHVPM